VLKIYGPVHGPRLNEAGATAPAFVAGLAERYGMDISIVRGGILRGAHSPAASDMLRRQADFWQARGAPVEFLSRAEAASVIGGTFYLGAQIDRRGIAINPLAWVRGLARAAISQGARLHEGTRMQGLERASDGWRVATAGGTITAGQVLLCTNAYTDDTWPQLRKTIIPVRGYQIWTAPLGGNVRASILRGISAMNDTRRLLTGIRLHPDGRLQFSGGAGFGAERPPTWRIAWPVCGGSCRRSARWRSKAGGAAGSRAASPMAGGCTGWHRACSPRSPAMAAAWRWGRSWAVNLPGPPAACPTRSCWCRCRSRSPLPGILSTPSSGRSR